MRRAFLKILASFDPNSKYDWFLLIMMFYLGFLTMAIILVASPEPPPPQELSPFG